MDYRTFKLITELNKFIILDIETTGFYYYRGDRITDICAYKVENGNVVDKFSTLVNPEQKIDREIEEITGITSDMVKWAKTFPEIAQDFVNFIGYDVIVGHNISFDWDKFLKPMLKDMCRYEAPNETICTLKLARTFLKELKSKKLAEVYKALTHKEPTITHRAEADVVLTTEVFNIMREFILNNKKQIESCYGVVS